MPEKLKLPNVTVVSIACNRYGETVNSLKKTLSQIVPRETLLITDTEMVIPDVRVEKIKKLNYYEYNRFVVKELYKYIKTDYILLVQWDSWVLDNKQWSDNFYNYDYIGATWLDGLVGNGGGSFRSYRFLKEIAEDDFIKAVGIEDVSLCRVYREYIEKTHDLIFAPPEVADRFSFELNPPYAPTFMFHGWHHTPFKQHVIIKRSFAMGDILMAEPLMAYYNDKGYQVVLDTPHREDLDLFFQHRFFIKHISEMDERISPVKFINLDGVYEKRPKIPVLQAYFEEAGVEDYELKNSQLNFGIDHRNKLFEKYVVIHNDNTKIPSRNARDVDWQDVVAELEFMGYTVIQIGIRNNEIAGTWMNTNSKQMLLYVLAGADLVIGIDSGVAQVAVALGRPTIILSGSVNLKYRYIDFKKIRVVQNKCPIGKDYCYHEVVNSEVGSVCEVDAELPPCCSFSSGSIIEKIKELICNI